MNCPKCGNQLAPNTKFCAKCGTPVAQQMPPMPVQQNVIIQKPAQPKPKKKNKNLPLIIVAIVLVIAVIASSIAVVPKVIKNNTEINNATEYIEDFPTLKQQTQFLVYDAEKFPSEKYEIKVERMLMGGIFNGAFKGETVLKDVSTERVYDLDFKEDGNYRITLTDITAERTQATSEQTEISGLPSENSAEVIEIIIIIDVVVDNDAEDAVDRVDINAEVIEDVTELTQTEEEESTEEPTAKFLEATDADFSELSILLESVSMPHNSEGEKYGYYDYKSENALHEASSQIMGPFNWLFNYYDNYFGWNSDWDVVSPEYTGEDVYSKHYDPLNKYIYDYMYFPADKVDWLLENAFNVKPQHTELYSETDGEKWLISYYYDGRYYVDTGDAGWVSPSYRVVNSEKLADGTYKMLIRSGYEGDFESSNDVYEIVAGVKEYNGKRYWSFYSISKYKEIPTDALEFNGHRYKIFTNICSTWEEAEEYCEYLGGHLAVISSKEENDALFRYMRSLELETAYFGYSDATAEGEWHWVNSEKNTYTNWHSGEPNGRTSENYAEFYYQFDDGTWNDGDFDNGVTSSDAKAFICEWN